MRKKPRRRRGCVVAALLIILILAALAALLNWVVMPLIVGRSRETVVPNLVGMNRFAAESVLTSIGLAIAEVKSSSNASVPADRVISQYPSAGRRVKLGRKVQLDVSRGAGKLRVPHTEGLTVARATVQLAEAGLVVDGVESLRTASIRIGQVVATRPPAGFEVNQGDKVIIQVSSRAGSFPMPNLVGMNNETAQGIIASQGLVLGEVKYAPSDEPPGSVLVQYPEEGMMVRDGDKVSLIVAAAPGKR